MFDDYGYDGDEDDEYEEPLDKLRNEFENYKKENDEVIIDIYKKIDGILDNLGKLIAVIERNNDKHTSRLSN